MTPSVPPQERLRRSLTTGRAIVAGVLSGTSADGVDVALLRFPPSDGPPARLADLAAPVCLAFETVPFPAELAPRVRAVLDGEALDLREVALLGRDLGIAFGRAAADLASAHGLALDLVGSHGQTVWHHDGSEVSGPATLQLGDGDFTAEAAGCAVACDFRQRDVAAGGQGAPLSALTDDILFRNARRPCTIVNLGGIANVTLLERRGAPRGFDTGPCNALLDGLARRLLSRPYDEDGAAAREGEVDEDFVRERLRHPFFAAPPPKSTGRDTFGEAWVEESLALLAGRSSADVLASGAALVAQALADALEAHGPPERGALYLAGGGVHHGRLVAEIRARTARTVATTSELGVDPEAREAIAFGCLGVARVLELPVTEPSVSGAGSGRVLGKLCAGPPQGRRG